MINDVIPPVENHGIRRILQMFQVFIRRFSSVGLSESYVGQCPLSEEYLIYTTIRKVALPSPSDHCLSLYQRLISIILFIYYY